MASPPANPGKDGVKSRKFILTLVSLTVSWSTATLAMFLDKMDSGTWVNFNQFVIPLILGVYSAANVAEKRMGAKDVDQG